VVRGWQDGVRLGARYFWVGVGQEEGMSNILPTLKVQWSKEILGDHFPFGVEEVEVASDSSKRRDKVCLGDGVKVEDIDMFVGDWAIGDSCTNLMFSRRAGILFIIGGSKVSIIIGFGGVVYCP
jgi:hypothetical protein